MGEEAAPCYVAPRRAGAAHFRLQRRKVHVVRLGGSGGGARAAGGRGTYSLRKGKLRWLRRAVWRLTALCVAALSGPLGAAAPDAPTTPWAGVEAYFAAPFVPSVLMTSRAPKDC